MSMLRSRWLRIAALLALCAGALPARAQDEAAAPELDRTPPRLSFTDGEVSFWRNGAEDWSPAQVNTPLGEGDQLFAGDKANLEIQIGARAFVRAGEQTQLGLTNLEPDFVQFRIVNGHASLDLRSVKAGTTIEIDTPHAAFTVEHPGYYRIEVSDENTSFTSRRGGSATVTPASGQAAAVAASETVVVSGTEAAQVETYAAAELDDWDRWNYTRTDQQLESVSARYVPNGVYGADDLDHYGDWRVAPTYGAVWFPRVATGWVPYSAGSWVYDPYYGWTWVDAAPWGWAPFHYGRWVSVGGYWGWAPGPLVARPFYSPALVAFYDAPGFSVGFSFGGGHRGWVALGWGEPCFPWWGSSHFRGHPHWNGWGGPRIVNNVVINKTTVINVNNVHWANAERRNAVVGVRADQFGRGRVKVEHFDAAQVAKLRTVQGDVDVKPGKASLAPTTDRGQRPPRAMFDRTVVATREAARRTPAELKPSAAPTRESPAAQKSQGFFGRTREVSREEDGTAARIVTPPKRGNGDVLRNRPPFGGGNSVERDAPPKPPRFRERPAEAAPQAPAAQAPQAPQQPQRGVTQRAPRPAREVQAPQAPAAQNQNRSNGRARAQVPEPQAPRDLPGEPANRVFRGRSFQAPRMETPHIEAPRQAAPQRVSPQQQQQQHARQPQQPQAQESGGQPPAAHGGGGGGWGRQRQGNDRR